MDFQRCFGDDSGIRDRGRIEGENSAVLFVACIVAEAEGGGSIILYAAFVAMLGRLDDIAIQ